MLLLESFEQSHLSLFLVSYALPSRRRGSVATKVDAGKERSNAQNFNPSGKIFEYGI